MTARSLLLLGSVLAAATPAAAQTRTVRVGAYVEASQLLDADLSGDGDVVTYTELAAGVDAQIATRRAEAQLSYRYEHQFGWGDNASDSDVHTGLARGSYQIGRGLSIEGGAIATRARSDIRGAAPTLLDGDRDNVAQLYSAYVGLTYSGRAGPVTFGASYRFGYTKVEEPNSVGLLPGEPRLDYYDSSTGHVVQASAAIAPYELLPVGITVSGGYDRENASQLKQRYEDTFARADLLAPVSRTVALTAGVGYEKIEVSQKDALRDPVTGAPVLDRRGRFVTDPASPRRIAYDTDGLIYDAGVVWRPSPRTELTATVGWRYGSTSYTGSFSWTPRRDVAVGVVVYDGVETFGHQLRQDLAALPTAFQTQRDSFGQQFNGCVFGNGSGSSGSGGAGGCLQDVFQSISTASYRARGIDAILSVTRGRDRFGLGAGYATRRLFVPDGAPGAVYYGLEDDSVFLQGFWSRELDRNSSVDANLYANWYNSGLPGADTIFGAGLTGSYYRSFGRIGTIAQLGLFTTDQQGRSADWQAQALLGGRYQF